MKFRCVKDFSDKPHPFFDNSMFAKLWLEPWFLGYPGTEVELGAEMERKTEDSEVGRLYRQLYDSIPTRVLFPDPSSGRHRSVGGFLAVIANDERMPVILFSFEEVSTNRYLGFIHRVYEKETGLAA